MLELINVSKKFGQTQVFEPTDLVVWPGRTTVLIGAGGYVQPILTGIRRDDVSLILQGAIPAALLALLVQGLFGLIESRTVPKGLRTAS